MPVRRFEQSEPDDMALRQSTGLAVPPGMPISERQQMAMIREMMSKEAAASTETKLSGKLFRFVLHTLQSRYQFVVRRLACCVTPRRKCGSCCYDLMYPVFGKKQDHYVSIYHYLHQKGLCFSSSFVCLFVNRITQNNSTDVKGNQWKGGTWTKEETFRFWWLCGSH